MSGALSVYLDLLRALAAVTVVMHHLPHVSSGYELFAAHGDDAVLVFFVLSGFVIAHVAATKERTAGVYMAGRFARLYSVVIPALLLTVVMDFIGIRANPAVYAGWYESVATWPLVRLAISLTFTNQFWSFDIRPFSNTPYWSISYEFWYYVLFAVLTFARSKWLIALWAVLVGPAMLLLLPIWLAGVWLYRKSKTFETTRAIAWAMTLLPILAYVIYCALGVRQTLTALTDPLVLAITGNPWYLHKARFFLHDYAVAAMICVHFLGVLVLFRGVEWKGAAIKKAAAYTFSLYLLHYPAMFSLSALIPWAGWTHDALVLAGVAAIVFVVGNLCESRKNALRDVFLRLLAAGPAQQVARP